MGNISDNETADKSGFCTARDFFYKSKKSIFRLFIHDPIFLKERAFRPVPYDTGGPLNTRKNDTLSNEWCQGRRRLRILPAEIIIMMAKHLLRRKTGVGVFAADIG
ncbi:MAG: hypothetical protein IKN45_12760, partial [Lachnospiraceae bacterium]|nr:hypothetical protein [Lachnospiraceae bacterium]